MKRLNKFINTEVDLAIFRLIVHWVLAIGLILLFSTSVYAHPSSWQATSSPVARAIFFYSPTCGHCHHVISELLLPMGEEYSERLQIVAVDVSQAAGGQMYTDFLTAYNIPSERQGVPTLVIGDTVLVGSLEIPEQFPQLVEDALAAGGIAWPAMAGLEEYFAQSRETAQVTTTAEPISTPPTVAQTHEPLTTAQSTNKQPVYLAYFYDPTCLECRRVSADLDTLEQQHEQLVVRRYDLTEEPLIYEAMAESFAVPEEQRLIAPVIFLSDHYLIADQITPSQLQTLIEDPRASMVPPPWATLQTGAVDTAATRITTRFQQFGPLAIAGAGLLDGVNPCAFTTMIFFISYLALVGRQGREILLVGIAFTAGVFITYMLLGLGLLEVAQRLGAFPAVGRIIYGITAIVCLGLALVSFYDYIKIRRGKLSEIVLQLPKSLKKRIHATIRSRSRVTGFVAAAFGAGILVSIFELACTGQVYLPTIVFVTGIAEMRAQAVTYLVLYNFMFILPLVAIFAVTYWGTSSDRLTTFFQQHVGAVKLLTVGLFGLMGTWLGYMVIQM